MQLNKLSEHIYYSEHDTAGDRPVLGYIRGSKMAVMVDAAYVPEEKILFIGNIYGDDFYQNHSRSLEKTQALYDALDGLDFSVAVPGHSGPVTKENLLQFLGGFLSTGA